MQRLGTSELDVFEVCLGGNVFGWTIDAEQSSDVLDGYTEAGGNFIDTADAYSQWVDGNSGGESETIIGNWIAKRGNRAELVIATKGGSLSSSPGLSPENVRASIENSLRRLQTDHIDLYYAHRDDGVTPIDDIYETCEALVQSGKVRYVAASNFSGSRLRDLAALTGPGNHAFLTAFQAHYNLVERAGYETTVRPELEPVGIPCIPFYSLASGFLTGKYRPGSIAEQAGARQPAAAAYLDDERNIHLLNTMDAIARDHRASLTAVALAWLRAQPTVAVPTASVTNRAQLTDLVESATLTLAPATVSMLDEASRRD